MCNNFNIFLFLKTCIALIINNKKKSLLDPKKILEGVKYTVIFSLLNENKNKYKNVQNKIYKP